MDKDLSSAKALYEQMQKEGVPADELSLKRLAVLYRNQGETAPFPEPPVSQAPICELVSALMGSLQMGRGGGAEMATSLQPLNYRKTLKTSLDALNTKGLKNNRTVDPLVHALLTGAGTCAAAVLMGAAACVHATCSACHRNVTEECVRLGNFNAHMPAA